MVLRKLFIFLLLGLSGCATAGYERYGVFDVKRDNIYQHRASFMGGTKMSMAYSIVYWDAIEGDAEREGKAPEIYYVWLRNDTSSPITIDPNNLFLSTEKGERFSLSPLTEKTISPLRKGELAPRTKVGGYVAFDVSGNTIEMDKPSLLVYDDGAGNKITRYLLVDDMKKYEGLVVEEFPRYYAPIYPRNYWYPYYYPYDYYPYDLRLYFFYDYEPRRRHYYIIPSEPERRKFDTPSTPREREFQRPSPESEKKREF